MERYSTGSERNRNGEKLVLLAESNNLKIANTFFPKRLGNKWTWKSPDSITKNETDFILMNDLRVVQDTGVSNENKIHIRP